MSCFVSMGSWPSGGAIEMTARGHRLFLPSHPYTLAVANPESVDLEQAVAECISDDALIHLKTYKYSSVDKSPVSKYILGPWVWPHRSNHPLASA